MDGARGPPLDGAREHAYASTRHCSLPANAPAVRSGNLPPPRSAVAASLHDSSARGELLSCSGAAATPPPKASTLDVASETRRPAAQRRGGAVAQWRRGDAAGKGMGADVPSETR